MGTLGILSGGVGTITLDVSHSTSSVPEPTTVLLLGGGPLRIVRQAASDSLIGPDIESGWLFKATTCSSSRERPGTSRGTLWSKDSNPQRVSILHAPKGGLNPPSRSDTHWLDG